MDVSGSHQLDVDHDIRVLGVAGVGKVTVGLVGVLGWIFRVLIGESTTIFGHEVVIYVH